MIKQTLSFLFTTLLAFAVLGGCRANPPPTVAPSSPAPIQSTVSPASPGKTLLVTSTADSGPGSLRQALGDAQPGDTITFDPDVFPPDRPTSIALVGELPWITQGSLTIDASNAGVILDGSGIGGEWTGGVIIDSEANKIWGLQIIHFTGAGIILYENAVHNIIGGDRGEGSGPLGQGNLSSDNSDGIAVFGGQANTILGNLIGTDVTGQKSMANLGEGVLLQDGAQENIIGPNNVIAFNGDAGIDIRSKDSPRNTIRGNSIHDNTNTGIRLLSMADLAPAPPIIWDFDLAAGTLAGGVTACLGCRIEVFSDAGQQGAVFEVQTTTDSNGVFILSVGKPFAGSSLTATVTDREGTTSEFSLPTVGARQSAMLQDRNDLPRRPLQTKRFVGLDQNRIGDMFPLDRHPSPCPVAEQDWSFTHVGELGLKWVRLSLDRLELSQAQSSGDYSQFSVNECQDQIVTLLAENDITILYTIVYWDKSLHTENSPDYGNEVEIQHFLDYTRLIVQHFKDRVQYFEILNEAVHYVDLADYLNLIRRVVPVIREEAPEAKIVVGGATDLRHQYSRDYLFGVLQSDVMPLVDAIAIHPMYGPSPQYDEIRQYYYGYPSLIQQIRDIAFAHGFSGEYFAEEMSWRTSINPNPYEPWEYSAPVAAKYYARGIMTNLGMDLWAGVGGEMYDTIPPVVKTVQNLSTVMAGAKPDDVAVKIQSEAPNIVSYTFALPNGDHLIALWTDGIAGDDDPDVNVMLTFPTSFAQKVIGVDVLHGFEQELITETENGNMVIRNLLVKDYPIMLRLTN
jgi:parallel beta-helix repeat protein